MTVELPDLLNETWVILSGFIAQKDHSAAALQLMAYLNKTINATELQTLADVNGENLMDAYESLENEYENEDEEYDDRDYDEYDDDEDDERD